MSQNTGAPTCEPVYSAYNDKFTPLHSERTTIIPPDKVYKYPADTRNDLTLIYVYDTTIVHYVVHQSKLTENSQLFAQLLKSHTAADYIRLPNEFYWTELELQQFVQLLYYPTVLEKLEQTKWSADDFMLYTEIPTDKIGVINLGTQLKIALYFDCKNQSKQLINTLVNYVKVHHLNYALPIYCIATTYNIKLKATLQCAVFHRL